MLLSTSFNIILNGNFWFLLLLSVVFVSISFYIYKYTLPRVSKTLKFFLVIIRSSVFILLIVLLFDPTLSITTESIKKKVVAIFIDDSNSLAVKDSAKRIELISNFVKNINSEISANKTILLFGNQIDSISFSNFNVSLNKPQTNYEILQKYMEKNENKISSAIIVSDGIITEGIDPSFQFEKLPFPIYTIGIGDTSLLRDIKINDIKHNQLVLAGKENTIETTILQEGYDNKVITVSLFEENKVISSKSVSLSTSGMNKLRFSYTPATDGEKKLRFEIQTQEDESNKQNNSKTFFVNVVRNKIKVALLAGAPSADVSAISNAIENDKEIQLHKNIEIATGRIWNESTIKSIDSAKILFLVGFPSKFTNPQFFNNILKMIENGKPFFISISSDTDFDKLKQIEKYLPISINSKIAESLLVQAELNGLDYSSSFSQYGNNALLWNNLTPIDQLAWEFTLKPEGRIIVRSKLREMFINNPLIAVRSIANQKSFLLNGWNYWRWGLQSAEKNNDFFKNFIQEIIKWLNTTSDKKQFQVTTNKKIYSQGEFVEFTAEVFDNSFNPIDSAKVNLDIFVDDIKMELTLSPTGNGIYNSTLFTEKKGDFTFTGKAKYGSLELVAPKGRFIISNSSAERIDTKMRVDYLQLIASYTNGIYLPLDSSFKLIQKLNKGDIKKDEKILLSDKFELKENSLLLGIILFLFSLEWFLRKKFGMI